MTDADAIEVAAQVLDGLAHAHERGIVHRDVKPANVLLADEDEGISVRILDFGLARFAEGETLTAAGDVPGTLAYIAPERLHGEPAGAAGDVWSVGVLLYEALAGRHPFWRSSLAETAEAIAAGRAAAPHGTARPAGRPARDGRSLARARSCEAPLGCEAGAPAAPRARRSRSRRHGVRERRAAPAASGSPRCSRASTPARAPSLLPFYPAHAGGFLALAAAVLTFFAPRAGLALALALPVLPLGNVALALALVYAALALLWFVVYLREPERRCCPCSARSSARWRPG